MSFQPQHILITGAAGAIGGQLVRAFATKYPAARQLLVDRPGSEPDTTGVSVKHVIEAVDLTALTALSAWYERVSQQHGEIDLLVNCAGVMDIMSFSGTSWERGKMLLDINLLAPMRLMDLALPDMLSKGRGGVINIASMAGRVPLRGCSYYGAAKAGIGNASEIARMDHLDQGVQIMTVYPGPIYSGLESHARSQVRDGLVTRHLPTGKPEELARRIVAGFARGDARVIYPDLYGAVNHVANLAFASWLMGRVSPRPNQ